MKISLEEMAQKISMANSFIITVHVNPDGDALGSALGLKFILEGMGKEAKVVIDDKWDKNFSILSGIESVINLQENPEEKFKADYVILLDASIDRCGKVIENCPDMKVLNIDHHVSNDDKADFLYLDADAPATAEIIYRLAKVLKVEFNTEIAVNLYTGMATDTGFFRYSNTKPYTMIAAAEMMEAGAKPNKISEALEVKSYETIKGLAAAMQTIEISGNGKVAGVYLPYEIVKDLDTTEGFIDQVRIIEGVDVAVLMKEKEPNLCRVSMRSKETNVSAIAQSLGGGGHIRAAGATIELPLDEAKKKLLEVINEALV